jgi:large subunit ribosomal protein L18
MSRLTDALRNRKLRKHRVRAVVSGTTERPRLTVFISNRHVSAQLIDDTKHVTIAAVTTAGKVAAKGSLTERAAWVGSEIANKAKKAKINRVVFDRNGRLYHGRVKALAEAAREQGLEF